MSKLKFSPIIKIYLHQLKRNKTIITSNKNNTISLNEFKKGYKIWKEGTTTSPSGQHLGHHHALLAPDGVQYDNSNTNFADTMWGIHNNITNITLLNEKPLSRWLLSLVIILPKDPVRPRIHRIRLINTYESDYNMVLKFFWPKEGLKMLKNKNGWGLIKLEVEQTCLQ